MWPSEMWQTGGKGEHYIKLRLKQKSGNVNNTLGCMAGLILDLICVAAAVLLVVTQ